MLILYLYKKEKKPFIGCWQEPHIISSQRVSSDSTGSNSSPQKFGDKLWLGFTKRDGSCAYWPSWRWAYWWQGEAWDGLDIVLSMSSRLARRWQTLITPSQFVKQEERLRWGWGGGTGAAFRDGRAHREFQKSAGILFCATLRPLGPVMVRAKGDWIAPLRFEPASLLEPQLLKSRVCDSLCFFYLWVQRLLIL